MGRSFAHYFKRGCNAAKDFFFLSLEIADLCPRLDTNTMNDDEEKKAVDAQPPRRESIVTTNEVEVLVPPDGGRGWLVVLGSFLAS